MTEDQAPYKAKRTKKKSPMRRTLEVIKEAGLKYWIVEYYNTFSGKRIDLFGIIDLIVLDGGILGIQVTGSDFSSHIKKLTVDEAENTRAWLEAGGRLEIWGWRKLKVKRGGKATTWKPRIADVILVNQEIYVEEATA